MIHKTKKQTTSIRSKGGSITAFVILLYFFSSTFAQQYPIHEFEPVVVTASRIPTTFSEITRNVIILNQNDIESAHVNSIENLLEYALGVDVKQRGPQGVQSDVSIRGSTFEQTLVLIDGIKVCDPQTGHHNMDLPLTLNDIERIEILKGSGSKLFGPNAFGGVINIITKKGDKKYTSIKAGGGDYKLTEGIFSLSYPIGIIGNHFSIAKRKSDGYRDNTDFDIFNTFYRSSLQLDSREVDFSLGYTEKKFGANGFYSDKFPNQREKTKTTFLNIKGYTTKNWCSISSKLFYRKHKDHFILDKERPDWYQNFHTTGTYGIEIQSTIKSKLFTTNLGSEIGKEGIESNSLGNHSRINGGLFFEGKVKPYKNLTVIVGSSAYYYTKWGWKTWPGIDFGYQLTDKTRLFGSIGKSFRVPTFTELYYSSPANMGNQNLKPEEAWTFETGISLRLKPLSGNISIFRREGTSLIDWVRNNSDDPWEAQNIARINTNGLEITFEFDPKFYLSGSPISRIRAGYSFLDSEKDTKKFDSKYLLNYLRHQIILEVEHNLFWQFIQKWKFRYEDREFYNNHFIVDTQISLKYKNTDIFINIANLLNTSYSDIGGIPMPGRWIRAGMNIRIEP